MSDKNNQQESGEQGMKSLTFIMIFGLAGMLIVVAGGILYYAFINPPAETAESETTTTSTSGNTAVIEDEVPAGPPPLAVLPPVTFPPDNPYSDAKAELGRTLFFDNRFSGDGSLSCNSCHPASDGSWGVSSPISFGYPGSTHWRNSSTLINVAYLTKLNWDGGKTSLEKQNKGAWGGAVAGNLDGGMAEERMAQIPGYVEQFNAVFGDEYPLYNHALDAVATFQRTLVSQNVPFDAYLEGDESAISDEAKAGYELFTGKANCIACHNGPLVSDDSFHNTGVPNAQGFEDNVLNQITFRYEQWAKGVTEEDYNTATEDFGLYYVTKVAEDRGKFSTPTLRETCYTAPYMHNGSIATLEEVVSFYNAGGGEHPNKDTLLQPLNLSADEEASLVSFLESLCGDKIIVTPPELPPYEPWDMSEASNR